MGRAPRTTVAGLAYHLLNRRVMRLTLFAKPADYEAFERVLAAGLERSDAPQLLAYCLMPNHWHLAVRATTRTDLSRWMQWVSVTHTHRWHAHHQSVGQGPLYQGRFRSFPVAGDQHLLMVCRYIEANPRRARLVKRAQDWRWGSLWARERGVEAGALRLAPWPVDRPRRWLEEVNRPWEEAELARLRTSVARGAPLGGERWVKRMAAALGLGSALRPRGRPRMKANKST